MSLIVYCDANPKHKGRLFTVIVKATEVGKTHSTRRMLYLSAGHRCEDCLDALAKTLGERGFQAVKARKSG